MSKDISELSAREAADYLTNHEGTITAGAILAGVINALDRIDRIEKSLGGKFLQNEPVALPKTFTSHSPRAEFLQMDSGKLVLSIDKTPIRIELLLKAFDAGQLVPPAPTPGEIKRSAAISTPPGE